MTSHETSRFQEDRRRPLLIASRRDARSVATGLRVVLGGCAMLLLLAGGCAAETEGSTGTKSGEDSCFYEGNPYPEGAAIDEYVCEAGEWVIDPDSCVYEAVAYPNGAAIDEFVCDAGEWVIDPDSCIYEGNAYPEGAENGEFVCDAGEWV
ncbi:MAG: hypothetical protein JRH11_07850 [Deltaproteobacteria bacterium]|nr:hypothetical protein [Deltaproteobacteria bacterium]